MRAALFTNILSGDANNLLSVDPLTEQPITFDFTTNTYDLDVSNVQSFAGRHVLSYGGNFRLNFFDLSIAPTSDDRTEFGVFAQDEIFLSNMFRWIVGARVDRFDYIDDFVFSPRTALMIKPQEDHTFRVSYNRAYRVAVGDQQSPRPGDRGTARPPGAGRRRRSLRARCQPVSAAVNITGNTDLEEQSLDAFEIGYSGAHRPHGPVGGVLSQLDQERDPLHRGSGRPLHGRQSARELAAAAGLHQLRPGRKPPGRFTYMNFGKSTQQGLELGVNTPLNEILRCLRELLVAGRAGTGGLRPLGAEPAGHATGSTPASSYSTTSASSANLSVSYSDSAYWQDVLTAPYRGNDRGLHTGQRRLRLQVDGRPFTTTIKAMNLGNDEVQQHAFGDVIKRQIMAELSVNFAQ